MLQTRLMKTLFLIGIVLIVLRFMEKIDWNWGAVTAPIWGSALLWTITLPKDSRIGMTAAVFFFVQVFFVIMKLFGAFDWNWFLIMLPIIAGIFFIAMFILSDISFIKRRCRMHNVSYSSFYGLNLYKTMEVVDAIRCERKKGEVIFYDEDEKVVYCDSLKNKGGYDILSQRSGSSCERRIKNNRAEYVFWDPYAGEVYLIVKS